MAKLPPFSCQDPCRAAATLSAVLNARQVAFLAGAMYTLVGLLDLGWVANFISHSVISGFMSGAAIIIGLSQVDTCSIHHILLAYVGDEHMPNLIRDLLPLRRGAGWVLPASFPAYLVLLVCCVKDAVI